MSLPTPAELKKLATACRKSGIKHFKCGDVEFTLGEEVVKQSQKSPKAESKQSIFNDNIETEGWNELTDEQKMFYSVGGMPVDGSSS